MIDPFREIDTINHADADGEGVSRSPVGATGDEVALHAGIAHGGDQRSAVAIKEMHGADHHIMAADQVGGALPVEDIALIHMLKSATRRALAVVPRIRPCRFHRAQIAP
ncbi:hypothetical protein [Mesorhizobium erdmanii]|uniref:hypothetical protein n=1 Tax=Mesorhizobium erdmanii TaxID=1777866 RepID=UPI001427CBB2|nr:hypothetical protein [Mesorhizobium erdmanii]